MKITKCSTHLLTTTWREDPWFPQTLMSTAIIRVDTDTGIHGRGEARLGYFTPETVPPLVRWFEHVLIGRDPMRIHATAQALSDDALFWSRSGAGRSVMSGIEMALWDTAGKALGVP